MARHWRKPLPQLRRLTLVNGHSPQTPRNRDLVLLAIALVALAALVALIGPLWVARAGGLVAVAAVAVSIAFARRELTRSARRHAAEVTALVHDADAAAKAHHEETMQVIGRYSAKVAHLRGVISATRADLADAQAQLATREGELRQRAERLEKLRSSNAVLADANSALIDSNAALKARIALLEKELVSDESALRESVDAEILTLPRRAVAQLRAELLAEQVAAKASAVG